jgi:cytoskeletal protein CcmA (bactofilin family)
VSEHAQTFLDQGTRFEGRILVTGIVRLDGYFKGDGQAQGTLVIGEHGVVEADLDVERLVIHGTFSGTVRARERVEVGPTGRVDGNIHTPCLQVHEGALLTAQIAMGAQAVLARVNGDTAQPAASQAPGLPAPGSTPTTDADGERRFLRRRV